ncbi:hypothetical protein Btru_068372 [Bulinus truncatus]|nr:hypothetical protein Btru_068372 [Bulinus truncatus]
MDVLDLGKWVLVRRAGACIGGRAMYVNPTLLERNPIRLFPPIKERGTRVHDRAQQRKMDASSIWSVLRRLCHFEDLWIEHTHTHTQLSPRCGQGTINTSQGHPIGREGVYITEQLDGWPD